MSLVFQNNPIELKQLVNKIVEIEAVDGSKHEGTVYTIDPVSQSIVLVKRSPHRVEIIFHHAVRSLKETGTCEGVELFSEAKAAGAGLTEEELAERREQLRSWLEKNLIGAEISGNCLSLTACSLLIRPPYGPTDCVSSNEIVLGKIQRLIEAMPSAQTKLASAESQS